jgi:uroporphyrinogen decarboxylase
VLAAFRRQVPDRVPKHASFTPAKLKEAKSKTGGLDPAEAFGFEMRSVAFGPPRADPDFSPYLPTDLPPGTTSDEWGLTEKPGSFYHFTEYVYPMAGLERVHELDGWPFPDYTPAHRWQSLRRQVEAWHAQGYFVMGSVGHIFETAWYIRSMEQLFWDMRYNASFAERLLEEITRRRVFMAIKYAEAGVDCVHSGDDVGTQWAMLMSPEMWRTWLKPRWERVIQAAKAVRPDLLFAHHSDGDILPIIPELADIGVDVLNPVQPECLDIEQVKASFGDRLAFWGGMGIQTTMPFGSERDVREQVKRIIHTLGRDGGLLIAPTHVLEPEVPWNNIRAFFEAVDAYGVYG